MELHFLRTLWVCLWVHNTFCLHKYWVFSNDIWWSPTGLWCSIFPSSSQPWDVLISLRLTISLTTYHKMYLFPHFYAYFYFPTRYRFNCSFELPESCGLPSVGDSITVSIQLSRESELHFWNVRKIKCKLGAFSLAGCKGIVFQNITW